MPKKKLKPVKAWGFTSIRGDGELFGAPVWIEFYKELADSRVVATNKRLGWREIKSVRVTITVDQ